MNNFISLLILKENCQRFQDFMMNLINNSNWSRCKNLDLLEKSLANFLKVNYCSTLNSGTDALILSLIALDIGPGRSYCSIIYILCYSWCCFTSKCNPVFADIEKDSFVYL